LLQALNNLDLVARFEVVSVSFGVNLLALVAGCEGLRNLWLCVFSVGNNALHDLSSFKSIAVFHSELASIDEVIVDCARALTLFDVFNEVAFQAIDDKLFLESSKKGLQLEILSDLLGLWF
jgi:hypothetical protein